MKTRRQNKIENRKVKKVEKKIRKENKKRE
jgi:hypothetical protein